MENKVGEEGLGGVKAGYLSQLETIQGSYGGMTKYLTEAQWPAIDMLGGDIFTIRTRLREFAEQQQGTTEAAQPRSITDLLDFVQAARLGVFGPAIPAFAAGGIAPGGMALVGEKGPEARHLPAGTRVHSNAESQGMMGGDQYFDIYIGGEKIAEHVRAQLRSLRVGRPEPWRAGVISR